MTPEDRILDAAVTVTIMRTRHGSMVLKTAHGRKCFAYCCEVLAGTKYEILTEGAPKVWDFEDDDATLDLTTDGQSER